MGTAEMGFNPKWIGWIWRCISSVSFSELINKEMKGFFKAERGIRQGDPLLSFLFTIVMQVLSMVVDKAAGHKSLSGFQTQATSAPITHLQFADDSFH